MLRRAAIVSFAVAALLVVACGHQVTPSPTAANNDLSGRLVVKFQVNGTLDFNDFTYAIVIDTCGNGTPYPQAYQTTFNSFSYAFFIGGKFGVALPQLVEYFVNPNSNGQIQYVTVAENASLEQFVYPYNGQSNEFELIFDRSELANPLNQAQPCPNITPTPVPSSSAGSSPGASPSASLTPSPSAAASTGASPAASPSATVTTAPNAYATTPAQQYWYLNFFTIQGNTILDSIGIGGPTDTTFNGIGLDTQVTQDYPIFKATGGSVPSNPAAQIEGGDVMNYQ